MHHPAWNSKSPDQPMRFSYFEIEKLRYNEIINPNEVIRKKMQRSARVSISCAKSTEAMAHDIAKRMNDAGIKTSVDMPSESMLPINWGASTLDSFEFALGSQVDYCIILLDSSYLSDKYYPYKRRRLIEAIHNRNGFVLPVQVGEDPIEIVGLTNFLGKIIVSPGDSEQVLINFMQKIEEVQKNSETNIRFDTDFERIISLYSPESPRVLEGSDRSRRIGYDIFVVTNALIGVNTNFICLYDGIVQSSTVSAIVSKHHDSLKVGPNIVLLPKDASHKNPETRKNLVSTAFNKSNIKINKMFYVDEFTWTYCTPDTFRSAASRFHIRGFVDPAIGGPDSGAAMKYIFDWYDSSLAPILLLKGAGGIGKTTLTQAFANDLLFTRNKPVFFIDDNAICGYFLKSPDAFFDGFSIYDAYRALHDGLDNSTVPISKEAFFANLLNGNFVIIIDGLDQVIARLGGRFSVVSFLETIYDHERKSYSKVIITCRAAFLADNYYTPQIIDADVLPFDRSRAEAFLSARFPSLPKVVERSLRAAAALTSDGLEANFYPFVLDIVANTQQSVIEQAGSDFGDYDDIPTMMLPGDQNDIIIHRICAREVKKYPQGLSAENQIISLLALAAKYRGIVDRDIVHALIEDAIGEKFDDGQLTAFTAHPLLSSEARNVSFRYEVIQQHFRTMCVARLFNEGRNPTESDIQLLAEHNKLSKQLRGNCIPRLTGDRDSLNFRALEILDVLNKIQKDGGMDRRVQRAKSAVFWIVLYHSVRSKLPTKEEATETLLTLFGSENIISNASIVDVDTKVIFDLSGKNVINCDFINMSYFWECEFDVKTLFEKCTLMYLPKHEGVGTLARRSNFNLDSCVADQTVLDALNEQAQRVNSERSRWLEDVSGFLKIFYKAGTLYPQKESLIKGRYHGKTDIYLVIDRLLSAGVVERHVNYKNKKIGPELAVATYWRVDVIKFVLEDNLSHQLKVKLR
jgi:hypothetical protein